MNSSFRDRHSVALVFVVTLLICVGGSLVPTVGGSFISLNEGSVVVAAVTTPFDSSDRPSCDIACGDGAFFGCADGWHDAWDTTPINWFWTRNGGVHQYPQDCREYTCDVRHGPYCPYPGGEPLTTADLERLRVAVLGQDAKAIVESVAARPREIVINAERSAVQIFNCKGRVVMHMPMAPKFTKLVASSLTSSQ